MIALTKMLDPEDYDDVHLLNALAIVDKFFEPDQHQHRRWEYAMALTALWSWKQHRGELEEPKRVADVGGYGSPLRLMLTQAGDRPTLIDPKDGTSVETWAVSHHLTPATMFHAVVSISTFEHTQNPLAFLEACHRILAPGGLLFLTFDYGPGSGSDTYHFNWMRERIVDHLLWGRLAQILHALYGYEHFGEVDWVDHGPHVYDYTFASLCMRKPNATDAP